MNKFINIYRIYIQTVYLLYYKNVLPNLLKNYNFLSVYGNFNWRNCSTKKKTEHKTNKYKIKLDILKLERGLKVINRYFEHIFNVSRLYKVFN